MNPGDLSRMAVFDGSDLTAGARLVLLSLAAASGPDNVAHVSAGRLATRCGLSEGHVRRLLRVLVEAQMVVVEQVPGRASKVTIVVPEAQERVRAGAQGGARRRAPFLVTLLGNYLRELLRLALTGLRSSLAKGCTSNPIPRGS